MLFVQPWDVTMHDLIEGKITLDRFRGAVFVGGFSYADVFGSAKGTRGKRWNLVLWYERLSNHSRFANRLPIEPYCWFYW